MRYAVVNKNMEVINVIIWDEKSNWIPPEGCVLIKSPIASIGDIYNSDTHTFIAPTISGE